MKLLGKRLLMLISDGVEEEEVEELRRGFESEAAEVFCTSPQEYLTVETVKKFHRGKDITIDFPIDAVDPQEFDGLIIPDGLLSVDLLRRSEAVLELVQTFRQCQLPIFASGRAVHVLHESRAFPADILVRDGEAMSAFIDHSIDLLLDHTSTMVLPRRSAAV